MTTRGARLRRTPRDARLVEMPDNFLDCRIDRHALVGEVIMQRWNYPDAETVERRVQCIRCNSWQVREIVTYAKTFDLEPGQLYRHTWYDYADGYLNPHPGTGRIPGDVVRLEAARRWMDANPLPLMKRTKVNRE